MEYQLKEVWHVPECSKFLKLEEGAVRNLAWRKKIPHRKKGGRLYFIPEEIQKWILNAPGVTLKDLKD